MNPNFWTLLCLLCHDKNVKKKKSIPSSSDLRSNTAASEADERHSSRVLKGRKAKWKVNPPLAHLFFSPLSWWLMTAHTLSVCLLLTTRRAAIQSWYLRPCSALNTEESLSSLVCPNPSNQGRQTLQRKINAATLNFVFFLRFSDFFFPTLDINICTCTWLLT